MSEDLPFGSRGGLAVRHISRRRRVRGQGSGCSAPTSDIIRGLGEPHQLDVRLDGARVKAFTVGGDDARGDLRMPMRPAGVSAQTPTRTSRSASRPRPDRALVGVTFLKSRRVAEGVFRRARRSRASSTRQDATPIRRSTASRSTGRIDARRPEDSPSRRRSSSAIPARASDEAACAQRILDARAPRLPAAGDALATSRRCSASIERGRARRRLRSGIQRRSSACSSIPNFLFRARARTRTARRPGAAYRVDRPRAGVAPVVLPVEQHSRRRAARRGGAGRLRDPAVARAAGARGCSPIRASKALVDEFRRAVAVAAQHARRTRPTRTCSPSSTRTCARRSSARPSCSSRASSARIAASLELLTANYTFVNERLARHYGIPNVYGSHFRRVTFTDDRRARPARPRQHLTVTSYANRTSPVRARQVAAREPPRHAAAAAAARRAAARGERRRAASRRPCASGWSSTGRTRCARAVTRGWIRWGSRSRTSTRIGQWRTERGGHADRCVRRAARRHEVQRAGGVPRRRCSMQPRAVRRHA